MHENPKAQFSWATGQAPPPKEVPEAVKGNPKRCHIDDCQAIFDTRRCRWKNSECRRKSEGGCRKFYCYAHRYETFTWVDKGEEIKKDWECCRDCKDDLDADIKAN